MPSTLQEKVSAAKDLVATFHFERITFLITSTLSALILILLATYSYLSKQIGLELFFALFLPTGGITFSCGLVLKMFSDCLNFLKEEIK